ncbi:MAG: hypothetical protein RL563_373 [Pseudomonadota bacterium]
MKPAVEVVDKLPQGRETPIYVTSARQKEECKQALRQAGFRIVDRIDESKRLLRVTIGIDQDVKACGSLNNVKFQLRFEERTVAEANGKGWTGTCQPNILTDMSQDLWRKLFVAQVQ